MKIGKFTVVPSIVNDRNKNFFNMNLLNNHVDFKEKPIEFVKDEDMKLWDLMYETNFILPFLFERCHYCPN